MKKIVFISMLIVKLLVAQAVAELLPENKKMIMVSPRHVESTDGKLLGLIYTEAFKRLGRELVYRYYPAKRASMMAAIGKVDGELARVSNYNEQIPDLIRVPEPVIEVKISAFTTNPDIKLDGWESLRNTDYRVEYMRGVRRCALKLAEVVSGDRLSDISHWEQGLRKIVAKRTDVYVEIERTVLRELKSDEFKHANIRVAGVMEEVKLYPFLHKKHAALVPQLAEILKEMKKEGLIQKYLKSIETSSDNSLFK